MIVSDGMMVLVGVVVSVAVWVGMLLTVEQPTRKMKVNNMIGKIARFNILMFYFLLIIRIVLSKFEYEITNIELALSCRKCNRMIR
jgi:hypothetical protein